MEWISAGTLGDLTITPRFFKGNIVARYIKDQTYRLIKENKDVKDVMSRKELIFMSIDFEVNNQATTHLLYYNGETLYSPTMESKSLIRDIKLQNILPKV